tara:strand:+ start:1635 stop:1847 length:213 start_codon:yes stop_codon:yes gene_type:complete
MIWFLFGSRGDNSEAKIATKIIKKSQTTEIKAHLFLTSATNNFKKDEELDALPIVFISSELGCDLFIILS